MNLGKHKDGRHHSILDQFWFAGAMFLVTTSLVVFVWWTVPSMLTQSLKNESDKGVFGDSFGSVNALFTGLAFTGVVFSMLLQQRQIRLQREDFLSQLNEMEESRHTIAQQNALLEAQNNLMRGQIEVQLLQIDARAVEMESRVDEIEAEEYIHKSPQRRLRFEKIARRASDLRNRAKDLEKRLI